MNEEDKTNLAIIIVCIILAIICLLAPSIILGAENTVRVAGRDIAISDIEKLPVPVPDNLPKKETSTHRTRLILCGLADVLTTLYTLQDDKVFEANPVLSFLSEDEAAVASSGATVVVAVSLLPTGKTESKEQTRRKSRKFNANFWCGISPWNVAQIAIN